MSIALRPFFRDFVSTYISDEPYHSLTQTQHSGMGMDVGHLNDDKYGKGSTVQDSGAFQMNNLPSKPKSEEHNTALAQDEDGDQILVDTCEKYRGTKGDTRYEAAVYQGNRNPSNGTISPHDFIRRDVEYVVTYDSV